MENVQNNLMFPLRIVVTEFTPALPENFVVRSRNQATSAEIHNANGAWMNAAKGGDKNTLDVKFSLVDSVGQVAKISEMLPIKVKLWTVTRSWSLVAELCEIKHADKVVRRGYRKKAELKITEKPNSKLFVSKDGTGSLKFKIDTTSKQHDGKKFSVEILPNLESDYYKGKFAWMFAEEDAYSMKRTSLYSQNSSLTFPIEVMSKINKLKQKKRKYVEAHPEEVQETNVKMQPEDEPAPFYKSNSLTLPGHLLTSNDLAAFNAGWPQIDQFQASFAPPEGFGAQIRNLQRPETLLGANGQVLDPFVNALKTQENMFAAFQGQENTIGKNQYPHLENEVNGVPVGVRRPEWPSGLLRGRRDQNPLEEKE
eukprot:maker-scaffold_14-snap-gene-5.62-mRNA-1 protein AED:0.32 eAED:0.32 QI:70/1/1/1/1/1/2/163/367